MSSREGRMGLCGIGLIAVLMVRFGACAPPPPPDRGIELVYRLEGATEKESEAVADALQKRLAALMVRQVVVRSEKPGEVAIRIPDLEAEHVDRVKALIGTCGKLRFQIVAKREDDPAAIERILKLKEKGEYDPVKEEFDIALGEDPQTGEPLPKEDPASYTLLENKGAISGALIARAFLTVDEFNSPAVGLRWDREGTRLFGHLTEMNKGRSLAIVIDGVVKSRPVIQERIGARAQITGKFTKEEALDLAIILEAGDLPIQPVLIGERKFGPDPGEGSGEPGKREEEKKE